MTSAGDVFRALALCTQRPGYGVVDAPLSRAIAGLSPGDLVDAAEHHGLDTLLFAHVRASGLLLADSRALDRLRARHVQHAHARAVRVRVMAEVLDAMERSRVRLLVLKGAALAQRAYADPLFRPMRDVDLLVHAGDLRRAHDVLHRLGFVAAGTPPGPWHHHLPGVSTTVDGATVTIELHHELLPRTALLTPLGYDDLAPASERFDFGGIETRSPGREDLLWHAYAHGFAINTLCPGTCRLIALADLVHGTEAWAGGLDWDRLRRRYPQLVRALTVVSCLVPWSSDVMARLGACARYAQWPVQPIAASVSWWSAISGDVIWPGEWWFRMRYGVTDLSRWLWYRAAGHPLAFGMSAARAIRNRVAALACTDAPRHQMLSPE